MPILGHGWARLDTSYWPAESRDGDEMFAALSGCQYTQPEGTPIFNDMLFGGFLIYKAPNVRVFIDDRCELYGETFIEEFCEAELHHPERHARTGVCVSMAACADKYVDELSQSLVAGALFSSSAAVARAPARLCCSCNAGQRGSLHKGSSRHFSRHANQLLKNLKCSSSAGPGAPGSA